MSRFSRRFPPCRRRLHFDETKQPIVLLSPSESFHPITIPRECRSQLTSGECNRESNQGMSNDSLLEREQPSCTRQSPDTLDKRQETNQRLLSPSIYLSSFMDESEDNKQRTQPTIILGDIPTPNIMQRFHFCSARPEEKKETNDANNTEQSDSFHHHHHHHQSTEDEEEMVEGSSNECRTTVSLQSFEYNHDQGEEVEGQIHFMDVDYSQQTTTKRQRHY